MTLHHCPTCHAPIHNPAARNCTHCGVALHTYQPLAPRSVVMSQYRIVRPIKQGGTGSIYLAEDLRTFNRRCVLKRLHQAHDAEARQLFAQEVQTVTRLRHPNIPQIYAYFDDGTATYIVMEYIAGTDLEQGLSHTLDDGTLLPGRPRPLEQVLRDGVEVCAMLAYLHSRRPTIVHCDIKPANLIRDEESNELYLVDFGAATIGGSGAAFGTPGYAPPEQYRGQRMPASDIYALSATLYHLLTDDDPTEHPGQFPTLNRLPVAVRAVLAQALNADPYQRPTADEFRTALEHCLSASNGATTLRFPSGTIPLTGQQFAEQARQHWSFAVETLLNGQIEHWLREIGQPDVARWLIQYQAQTSPDWALQALLRQLDPQLPAPEVRLSQQMLTLPITITPTATPLLISAIGGVARVRVVSTPAWLQAAPPTLTVRPSDPQTLHVALDTTRLNPRTHRGVLLLEAESGSGKPRQHIVTVAVEQSQQHLLPTPRRMRFDWVMSSLMLCVLLAGIGWALFGAWAGLGVQLMIGASIGGMAMWLTLADRTEAIIQLGLGVLGAFAGGTLLAAIVAGDASGTTPLALLLAFGGAAAAEGLYVLLLHS